MTYFHFFSSIIKVEFNFSIQLFLKYRSFMIFPETTTFRKNQGFCQIGCLIGFGHRPNTKTE